MTRDEFWADIEAQVKEDPVLGAMTLFEFLEGRRRISESQKAVESIFRKHVCHERDSCYECEKEYDEKHPMETDNDELR